MLPPCTRRAGGLARRFGGGLAGVALSGSILFRSNHQMPLSSVYASEEMAEFTGDSRVATGRSGKTFRITKPARVHFLTLGCEGVATRR